MCVCGQSRSASVTECIFYVCPSVKCCVCVCVWGMEAFDTLVIVCDVSVWTGAH